MSTQLPQQQSTNRSDDGSKPSSSPLVKSKSSGTPNAVRPLPVVRSPSTTQINNNTNNVQAPKQSSAPMKPAPPVPPGNALKSQPPPIPPKRFSIQITQSPSQPPNDQTSSPQTKHKIPDKPIPPPPPSKPSPSRSPASPINNRLSMSQSQDALLQKRPLPPPSSETRKTNLAKSNSLPGSVSNQIPSKTITSPHSKPPPPPVRAVETPEYCNLCGAAFEAAEPRLRALGKLWHRTCFVCEKCSLPFGEAFTIKESRPYHTECWKELKATEQMPKSKEVQTSSKLDKCAKCKKMFAASEQRMSALSKMWHKECFVCASCGNQFTNTFMQKNKKPYHPECWKEIANAISETKEVSRSKHMSFSLASFQGPSLNVSFDKYKEKAQAFSDKMFTLSGNMKEMVTSTSKNLSDKAKDITTKMAVPPPAVEKEKPKDASSSSPQTKSKTQQRLNGFHVVAVNTVIEGSPALLKYSKGDIILITNSKLQTCEDAPADGAIYYIGFLHGTQGFVNKDQVVVCDEPLSKLEASRMETFFKEIARYDLTLALAICAAIPREEHTTLIKALIPILNSGKYVTITQGAGGAVVSLIHLLIQREVNATTDPSTLFRSNSIASSLMTGYFHTIGKDYLKSVIGPLIQNMIAQDVSFEVDPAKATSSDDVKQNATQLVNTAESFLRQIIDTAPNCPKSVLNICCLLQSEVSVKFTESKHKYSAIGGFFFLRAMVPAIVSPDSESFGIVKELSPKARRNLVLLSKLLQNLSNGQSFKEDFMSSCDQFVTNNTEQIHSFFDTLGANYYSEHTEDSSSVISEELQTKLFLLVNQNLSKIMNQLEEKEMKEFIATLDYDPLKVLLDAICPPIPEKKEATLKVEEPPPKTNQNSETAPQEKPPRTRMGVSFVAEDITSREPRNEEEMFSEEFRQRAMSVSVRNYPEFADYGNYTIPTSFGSKVFGIPIFQVRLENSIPVVVEQTIRILEQNSIEEEGILRLAGSTSQIKQLKAEYDSGKSPDISNCDVHSVAGVLKSFFRELPRPPLLMTKTLKDALDLDYSESAVAIYHELFNIPQLNYMTLKRLFGYLCSVAQRSEKNKMTASNIAIVFKPTLRIPQELIETLITAYETIFYESEQ